MSAWGQSETSKGEWSTSVCPSAADLDQGNGLVSFVPQPEEVVEISTALWRQLCLTARRLVQCRRSICLSFIKVAPRQLLFKIVDIQQLANFTAWFANEATSPKRCDLHFF